VKAADLDGLWPELQEALSAVAFSYRDDDGAGMMLVRLIGPDLRPALRGE
jgi:hypothetical protein